MKLNKTCAEQTGKATVGANSKKNVGFCCKKKKKRESRFCGGFGSLCFVHMEHLLILKLLTCITCIKTSVHRTKPYLLSFDLRY